MGTAKFIRSKSDDIKKLMDTEWSHVKSEDKYMMDVDALRAVQTSGPTHSGSACMEERPKILIMVITC